MSFINTQYFREAAIHYEKHGRYADGEPDTAEWEMYWDEEHKRVEEGYSVGGVSITGKHYLYLNYLPIKRITKVKDTQFGIHKKRETYAKRVGSRDLAFPDFWDEDFIIFHTWDIAKYGITEKELTKLEKVVRIPILKTDDNLSGGHHHLWLKPRGVGASWKGAVIPIERQFFGKNNTTFILADQQQYLLKDGIFEKYLTYRNRLNKYSDDNKDGRFRSGFARQFSLMGTKEMEYRSSYWSYDSQGNKIEKGRLSSVMGVIINGDPNNARGKRGSIIFEEFGSFPKVDETWEMAQSSVEEDGIVFDTMYGFGTGGDEGKGIESLTKMFYDPKPYNILQFENKWDEHFFEQSCCYFTPAYRGIQFKDKDGNSLEEIGKEYYDSLRELKKSAKDPSLLPAHKAEKPYTPQEALLQSGSNIFPVTEILAHKNKLIVTGIYKSAITNGDIKNINGELKFIPDYDAIPYVGYPVGRGDAIESCISLIHKPFTVGGLVPKNLYRISVDPYRHDQSTGNSVGAIYVIENPNKLTSYKGDKIVAWFVGRPLTQDDFNEKLYNLALYYNCKIGIENDEPGGIIDYGKRKKLLHYLEQEFELAYDLDIKTKEGGVRTYGMHIGSGKNDLRKMQGDKYIQEWLLKPRGITEDGKRILNLHTIYDLGLLEELIKYKNEGNYDRISSLRINMFYEREFAYKNKEVSTANKTDKFFELELF